MGRPPMPPGTYGKILFLKLPGGQVKARVKFRDYDGRVRLVARCASTRAAAERALKAELAMRQTPSSGGAVIAATRVNDLADTARAIRPR